MWRQKLLKWGQFLALYLFWPMVVLVVWGEVNPHPPALESLFWDKELHFLAYFGLSGIACVALKADRRAFSSTLGLIVLGGVLEIVQGFTGRDPSWGDELANTLGAITGAGLGWALIRLLQPKIVVSVRRD